MESFLLEIGTEEIPAGYIRPALDALADQLRRKLDHARIDHGPAHTLGTPRRLAVWVEQVAQRQKPVTEQVLGPPERIAFDAQGNLSIPGRKFAEKVGLPPEQLRLVETEKGKYLCADLTDKGTVTRTVLKEILPDLILNLPFPKTMRWSDLNIAFARPIQSVAALHGKKVIFFTLDPKLKSGRSTRGHQFMHRKRVQIESAASYRAQMREAQVIVDVAERRQMVAEQVRAAASQLGGVAVDDQALIDTVTHLVEMPVALGGRFSESFLELPREILITSMREHQKYFAVSDDQGRLMPCFVAVNNTRPKDTSLVTRGHERVLKARLSDAQFFFRADLQQRMDDRVEKLKGVLFQAKLGSMHDKVMRVQQVAEQLAKAAAPEQQSLVKRAAYLCKADLVSHVVGEFANLQGIMGRVYAETAGEPPEVCRAIEEHYRPTFSGGPLPQGMIGALLAVADKLDTICGCFSADLMPTGASDPYALRRQGIGIVQIMLSHNLSFPLREALDFCVACFEMQQRQQTAEAVYAFLQQRIAHMLIEEGFAKDVVAAVIAVTVDHIPHVWQRARALNRLKGMPDFDPLAVAFKRVVNILRKAELTEDSALRPERFTDDAEKALYTAYRDVSDLVAKYTADGDFGQALLTIARLRAPVDRFFDDVMVMAEDDTVRCNRLALLAVIAALFQRIADFSKITV